MPRLWGKTLVWGKTQRRFAAALFALSCSVHAEDLFTRVDLDGWRRASAVTLAGECWDTGDASALLDDDRATLARASVGAPANWSLTFAKPCVVRSVQLVVANESARVNLTVVESGGGRFAVGAVDVSADGEATFGLRDVSVSALEFSVSELGDASLVVSDLQIVGALDVVSVALVGAPEALPVRGSFPIVVRGTDTRGGRPDLTDIAKIVATPQRALALGDDGRAVALVGGPVTLQANVGPLKTPRTPLTVTTLATAPAAPTVSAIGERVAVSMAGTPPFEVLRRTAGETDAVPVASTFSARWHDRTVELGTAYEYSYRTIDAFGNATSTASPTARARVPRHVPADVDDLRRMPVFVALFTDQLRNDGALVRDALDAARVFVFRHTHGALLLDIDVVPFAGPAPDTRGPSMQAVAQALRGAGVPAERYAFVYAITDAADGSYSGFTLLGDTPAGFGPTTGTFPATPPDSSGPLPFVTWSFLHEFNHALELTIGPASGAELLPTHHFDQDIAAGRLGAHAGKPFDAGDGWDGLAHVFAAFPNWRAVPERFADVEWFLDVDADGLADSAPQLPIDEVRLRTDPANPDSDGDLLDDMDEWCVGLYRGTDALTPDTDGDGVDDGSDAAPLAHVQRAIVHGEEPAPLASAEGTAIAASWTSDALRFVITTSSPADVFIDLDGSGALGRWESDVRVGNASDVYAGAARLALRAHTKPRGVFVGRRRVDDAEITASTDDNGLVTLTATIPANLGPGANDVFVPSNAPTTSGLRLAPGTTLGLAFTLRPSHEDDNAPFNAFPNNATWVSVFETHALTDVTLADA